MKKKLYGALLLLGMAVALFLGASVQSYKYDTKASLGYDTCLNGDGDTTFAEKEFGIVTSEIERLKSNIWKAKVEESKEEGAEPEESDTPQIILSESAAEELRTHYGSYRVTEFWPTKSYLLYGMEDMPKQEADMMIGRIIDIKQERLITYDTERWLGTRDGRCGAENYLIEKYAINDPQYGWESIDDLIFGWQPGAHLDMSRSWDIKEGYLEQIDGFISTPSLYELGGQSFFTFAEDKDKMLLRSISGQYFLLERCGEEAEEPLPEWGSQETQELMQGVYGEYQVTEFLPTKYFSLISYDSKTLSEEEASQLLGETVTMGDILSYVGYDKLSEEEAGMMVGKTIMVLEDRFVTYDNGTYDGRALNREEYAARSERQKSRKQQLKQKTIRAPDYRVKSVWKDEIYGIRDSVLTGDLDQQEYVEIDVYPGYEFGLILPQMYLVNDGRILLYAMGEYFLLEKVDS